MNANEVAFLSMISHAEGTDRAEDPYRVCYGFSHAIADMSDHPAITGEWRGESLASLGPQYARDISTAAGRYQINKPTWLRVKARLALGSFAADAQDLAAVELIRERGALGLVNAGEFALAVEACVNEWASLPGGKSHQPERSIEVLTAFYKQAGGVVLA